MMSACQFQGIDLRQDRRVEIVSPEFREEVGAPVVVDWTVEDFEVTGADGSASDGAGYFAVLVDLDPQPPGEDLDYLARTDETCLASDGCPDDAYLEDHGVFTTEETEITLDDLQPAPGVDIEAGERDLHEVTIILLDGQGNRIGEGSWTATFELTVEE